MEKTECQVYTTNFDDNDTNANERLSEHETSSFSFDFDKITRTSDFTLVVEGKSLHVSKAVLGLASPVFERMFDSDFKENSVDKIDLPGKCFADVLEFLRCIYPSTLTTVDRHNALKILPLAEEYQIGHLKSMCEKVLLNSVDDSMCAEELFGILSQTSLYNLKELRSRCIGHANSKTKDKLFKAKDKCQPPADAWIEILESLNGRMAKVIAEQEIKMQKISLEIKTNQFEFESLKLHWSFTAKESMKELLEPTFDWREETVVLVKGTFKNPERSVSIWELGLKVKVTVDGGYLRECIDWLCVHVENDSQNSKAKCQIGIHGVVLNRYFKEGSKEIKHKAEFSGYNQRISKDLVKMSEIMTGEFFSDGKMCVIVSIFMSKPFVP